MPGRIADRALDSSEIPERPWHVSFLLVQIVLVALLGAACAADTEPDATLSPVESTTTTASVVATTTVTRLPDPTEEVFDCPPDAAMVTARLGEDRHSAGVWIIERAGGQELVICDQTGSAAMELDYAVWYLAVIDRDADGSDELFVGAADHFDAVESPAVHMFRVTQGDTALTVVTDDPGIAIEPARDGCVDRNGLTVTDLSTATTCGGGSFPLVRVAPPAAICHDESASASRYYIDLDGDGTDDEIVQRQATGRASLENSNSSGWDGWAVAVCLGSGVNDQQLVGGSGLLFDVGYGPAGRPLIWTGGRTQFTVFRSALVMDAGRLAFLLDEGGTVFSLWDGLSWDGYSDDGTDYHWRASGCADLAGDGVSEFIQVEAAVVDDRLEWLRSTWTLDGRTVVAGAVDTGSAPAPVQAEPDTELEVLGDLAPDRCVSLDSGGSCDGSILAITGQIDGVISLFALDLERLTLTNLVPDWPAPPTSPAWDPTCQAIAFISSGAGEGSDRIYLLDIASGDTTLIAEGPPGERVNHLTWAPDGAVIAYSRGRDSFLLSEAGEPQTTTAVEIVDPALGTKTPAMTLGPHATWHGVYDIAWTANDGVTVLYASGQSPDADGSWPYVELVRGDGTRSALDIDDLEGFSVHCCELSPDARFVAAETVIGAQGGELGASTALTIIDLARGTSETFIKHPDFVDESSWADLPEELRDFSFFGTIESPTWSGDGTRVAFVHQEDRWECCSETGLPIWTHGSATIWLAAVDDAFATPIVSFEMTNSPWPPHALAWMPGS